MKSYSSVAGLFIIVLITPAFAQDIDTTKLKSYRIERHLSAEAKACIDCHSEENPGIVADWADSRHAHINVSCYDCHMASKADPDISMAHLQYSQTPISVIV